MGRFLHFLFLLLPTLSTPSLPPIQVPGRYPLSVILDSKDGGARFEAIDVLRWIKDGKSVFNVFLEFDKAFGLPAISNCSIEEELLKVRSYAKVYGWSDDDDFIFGKTPPNKDALSMIILNWCHWEWTVGDRGGVWDGDFRFAAYSLGLINLAEASITARVSFDKSIDHATTEEFVRLSLPLKLQEIVDGVKWAVDGLADQSLQDRRMEYNKTGDVVTKGLKNDSKLCFRALRPDNFSSPYNETDVDNVPRSTYEVESICVDGRQPLQDLRATAGVSEAWDVFNNAVLGIKWFIFFLTLVFLPVILIQLCPQTEAASGYRSARTMIPTPLDFETPNDRSAALEESSEDGAAASAATDADPNAIEAAPKNTLSVPVPSNGPITPSSRLSNLSGCFNRDNSGNADTLDEDDMSSLLFVALDDSTPVLVLFSSGLATSWFCRFCQILCRFVFAAVVSLHATIIMAILDRYTQNTIVQKAQNFTRAFKVEVKDLHHWNGLHTEIDIYLTLLILWLINLFIISVPKVSEICIEAFYPTPYFGPYEIDNKLVPSSLKDLNGLNRVSCGMKIRLGLLFKRSFWEFVLEKLYEDRATLPAWLFLIRLFSLLPALLSMLPVCAILPWNMYGRLLRRERVICSSGFCRLVIIPLAASCWGIFTCLIIGYLLMETLIIYDRFFVCTISATMLHYKEALSWVGLVGGVIGFLYRSARAVHDKYICLKLIIFDVATQIHLDRIANVKEQRDKWLKSRASLTRDSRESTSQRDLFEPVLLWHCREGLPYIPRKLYKEIVSEIFPIGYERAKVLVKLGIVAAFAGYMYHILDTLNLVGSDAVIDSAQAIVTFIVVVLPTALANLQSAQQIALRNRQSRYRVQALIEQFLRENSVYYNFEISDSPNGMSEETL